MLLEALPTLGSRGHLTNGVRAALNNTHSQSLWKSLPLPYTHGHTHTVSLPSLISTQTQTKRPLTYPLQPREMLVNINVPIHAGHPCQQLDSLLEKALFLARDQILSSSLLLPPPPQERQAVFKFPHVPGLRPAAFP